MQYFQFFSDIINAVNEAGGSLKGITALTILLVATLAIMVIPKQHPLVQAFLSLIFVSIIVVSVWIIVPCHPVQPTPPPPSCKLDSQEFVTNLTKTDSHQFEFSFDIKRAFVEITDNFHDVELIRIWDDKDGDNKVRVVVNLLGGGLNGAGIVRYKIWATSC